MGVKAGNAMALCLPHSCRRQLIYIQLSMEGPAYFLPSRPHTHTAARLKATGLFRCFAAPMSSVTSSVRSRSTALRLPRFCTPAFPQRAQPPPLPTSANGRIERREGVRVESSSSRFRRHGDGIVTLAAFLLVSHRYRRGQGWSYIHKHLVAGMGDGSDLRYAHRVVSIPHAATHLATSSEPAATTSVSSCLRDRQCRSPPGRR